jgi:ArsR family transcriptional regulator, arsenate/arsenite/antimonite-responsive transcriptional repressor
MGLTKTSIYSQDHNQMANLLKALAHPARVAILEHLLATDACICGDLVKELGLAQPTVSQHLKEMKNAGIIKGTVEGNALCYCLDENTIALLKKYFEKIVGTLENKKCC